MTWDPHTVQVIEDDRSDAALTQAFDFLEDVRVGSTVLVAVHMSGADLPSLDADDTAGNLWQVDSQVQSGSTVSTSILRANITTAIRAGDQLSITRTDGGERWVVIADAFEGIRLGLPDETATGTGTSDTPATDATGALARAHSVAFAGFGMASGRVFAAPAGWVLAGQAETSAGSTDRCGCALYRVISGDAGAVTASATLASGSSGVYSGAVAVYNTVHGEFPDDHLAVRVSLHYSGQWHRIETDVRVRDGISITRGRGGETSGVFADPARCVLTLNNRDGKYSPRNPESPLYGLIGRNTPIKVEVVHGGSLHGRFYGEVSAWPQRWDLSGRDVFVPIEASGIARRLGAGANPVQSPLRRQLTDTADLIAYWPCEDEAGATALASAVPGAPAMRFDGIELAAHSDFAASDPIPLMKTGSLSGKVPYQQAPTGALQVRWLMAVPDGGLASTQTILDFRTSGTARRWLLTLNSSDEFELTAYNSSGDSISSIPVLTGATMAGRLIRCSLILEQDGADLDWTLAVLEQGQSVGGVWDGTLSSRTVGRAVQVLIGPTRGLGDTAIGHVTVMDAVTSIFDEAEAFAAWDGERAGVRFTRLCTENGIAEDVDGTAGDTTRMGRQTSRSLIDLLAECGQAEVCVIDSRTAHQLVLQTRDARYGQRPGLTLDYEASGEVHPPLEPVEDDAHLANDVTVRRGDGGSRRVEVATGPLSTQDPPDGVGRYDAEATVNLWRDWQAEQHAAWRAHLGTVDEPRYPVITAEIAASPWLSYAAATCDLGDLIEVANTPSWLPPGPLRLMVEGYSERLDPRSWRIEWVCSPASAWDVAILEDGALGRAATAGSSLADAVDETETSWSLASDTVPWIDSATYPAMFPFDWIVGGELVTVTAITGTSSPQTATVTRSANGVVKSHGADTPVQLAHPMRAAL